jgi:hypothetical protein
MGGGMRMMIMRGPDGATMDEAAVEKLRTARLTAEMQRWMLALLARPAGEVTYAGVAESPDGTADTLEMKDGRGQTVRLFVDQRTHLPLMLAYEEVRPRMLMQRGPGGPGGRRGPSGGRAGTPAGPPPATQGGPPPDAGRGQRPSQEEMRRRIAEMPPPTPSPVRMSFAEYTTVDGVQVPTQIAITVDGTPTEEWTIEKIRINPALKADFFEKK